MQFGYCERIDGSFWAEPLNAVTNAAFLVAALAGFWLWRRQGGRDAVTLVLIELVFAIGIGSFLFHTVPNRWTLLADVVPIQLFALVISPSHCTASSDCPARSRHWGRSPFSAWLLGCRQPGEPCCPLEWPARPAMQRSCSG